jgi:hypothetical protein
MLDNLPKLGNNLSKLGTILPNYTLPRGWVKRCMGKIFPTTGCTINRPVLPNVLTVYKEGHEAS